MIGTITNLRPQLRLEVKGPGGQGIIEFTVDTGYTGTLTLSAADCAALQLTWISEELSRLADGTEIRLNVYLLTLTWHDREREVEILALGEEPLLGATLLEDSKICLDFPANILTVEEA